MWDAKHLIEQLVAGADLSFDSAHTLATHVATNDVDHHQLAAILALLAARGESAEVVAGFATAMRDLCVRVPRVGPACSAPLLDIVGTGGDGLNTVNISTASAVVIAAAGVPVAKHGSLSVSSRSGAADVLRELGVAMLPAEGVARCLDETGLGFMFAPLFHPALRHVVPLRRALRVRTIFNILGPLLNPAGASRLLLGVYKPSLLRVYADAAKRLGAERALVVHCCGLDELAPIGPACAVELTSDGAIVELTVDPATWGVPRCTVEDLTGGEPHHNAGIIRDVLRGGDAADSHVGRTIALNAGAALYVYGSAPSVRAGYEAALATMRSGSAGRLLQSWAETTQKLAAQLDEASSGTNGAGASPA